MQIKLKLKICKQCGRLSYIFSRGRCKPCALKSYNYKPKQSKYKPNKLSKRESEYIKVSKEFVNEQLQKGPLRCFFCNNIIPTHEGIHHLRGRIGKYLLDKRYFVLAHNFCHVTQYHSLDVEKLMELTWYNSFLERLKEKDIKTYNKEIEKLNK